MTSQPNKKTNAVLYIAHISEGKSNQKMKFGQLI